MYKVIIIKENKKVITLKCPVCSKIHEKDKKILGFFCDKCKSALAMPEFKGFDI